MQSGQPDSSAIPKCVVIGDACVGKTCMVACLAGKKPELGDYNPTLYDSLQVTVMHRGQHRSLEICDTAGQEDFANLRLSSYENTDLFLLCFCLMDRNSFENLESVWLSELRRHRGRARVILVGTKLDLYKQGDKASVSRQEINALRSKLGFDYVQCSSLTQAGIQEVLDKALDLLHGGAETPGRGKRRGSLAFKKCDIL